jgi:predicted secreted Zn-dependent protease
VQPSISEKYYEISGKTVGELVAAMDAKGLTTPNGRPAVALTGSNLSWSFQYEPAGTEFTITSVNVELEIEYLFPRRVTNNGQPDLLTPRWNAFLAALTLHEHGHGEGALQHAEMLYRILTKPQTFKSKRALEEFARREGDRVVALANMWNLSYDLRTNHGIRQGAILR